MTGNGRRSGLLDRIRRRIRWTARRIVARSPLEHWAKGEALSKLLQRTTDFDLAVRILETNRFRRAIRPTFLEAPEGERILVLAPHQDDAIIGAGGVLQRCVDRGKRVKCLYVTDGATTSREYTPEETVEVRRREAVRVWKTMGAEEPEFRNLPCGDIPLGSEVAGELGRSIRKWKPDVLFIPFFLEDPNDHRKTNHLLWLADREQPLPEMEIWAYQITTMIAPNVGVDISDQIERKQELMELWELPNSNFDYTHQSRGMAAANTLYFKAAHPRDAAPKYVELFFVLPAGDYLELLGSYFGVGTEEEIYGKVR